MFYQRTAPLYSLICVAGRRLLCFLSFIFPKAMENLLFVSSLPCVCTADCSRIISTGVTLGLSPSLCLCDLRRPRERTKKHTTDGWIGVLASKSLLYAAAAVSSEQTVNPKKAER